MKWDHDHKGHIISPFGRRWRAPLSWNELVNYPIQATASDIVVKSQVRLVKLSHELGEPQLCPRINVHDELTFMIDEDKLESLIPLILPVVLEVNDYAEWLKVPLTVEVMVGDTWGKDDLVEIGKFSSTDWAAK